MISARPDPQALALEVQDAEEVSRRLAEHGVMTDSRGHYLRLGPAPYLTDDQLARTAERVAVVALCGAPHNGKRKRLRGV